MNPWVSRRLALFAFVALASTAGRPGAAFGAAQADQPIAFVGVNVLPMDEERIVADQVVIVREGRIAALGARGRVSVPKDARQVDGTGRYLLPGLADMHAHLSGYNTGAGAQSDATTRSQLLLYLATGVTTVRNMRGSEAHLDYKKRVAASELLGPRVFTTTNLLDGPDPEWPGVIIMSDPAAAGKFIHESFQAGYDQIKIYNGLPRAVYTALLDAAARHDMKVVGHVPFAVGIDAALASGQYSIEHQRGYDYDGVRPEALELNGGRNAERFGSWLRMSDERMRELVRKTVAGGMWNCPTLVVDDFLSDSEKRARVGRHKSIRFVAPEVRARIASNDLDKLFPPESKAALRRSFPQKYKLVKMLSDAGAGLLIGTDTTVPYLVPGFTPIDEMQHFVKAGLTPYRALRASTADAARFLGISADSGTIAAGMRADLILVDADPLQDIANLWKLSGVMANGRWLPRAELHTLMEAMAASYPGQLPGAGERRADHDRH